jgi:hypothetical protein
VDDFTVRLGRIKFSEILCEGASGNSETVTVNQVGIEEMAKDDGYAANPIDVAHVVATVRLGVGNMRNPSTYTIEVGEIEIDPALVGDGEQVKDGIGGTSNGHDDSDRVLESLFGHDLPGPEPQFKQLDDRLSACECVVIASTIHSGNRRTARKAHAQGFGHRGHGVGGEHAGA